MIAAALGLLSRIPVLVWALGAVVAWGGWQRHQVRSLDADLAQARLELRQAEAKERATLVATAAAAQYEGERAAITKRSSEARHVVRKALAASVQCTAGASAPALADVVIPAAAMRGLRLAAGQHLAAEPAAGEPGGPMRSGPSDPRD